MLRSQKALLLAAVLVLAGFRTGLAQGGDPPPSPTATPPAPTPTIDASQTPPATPAGGPGPGTSGTSGVPLDTPAAGPGPGTPVPVNPVSPTPGQLPVLNGPAPGPNDGSNPTPIPFSLNPAVSPGVAPAPGPADMGAVIVNVSMEAEGFLGDTQQNDLCQQALDALPQGSGITDCSVDSEVLQQDSDASQGQDTSSLAGRRLKQTTGNTSIFLIGLRFTPASNAQAGMIQSVLSNTTVSVTTTTTTITVTITVVSVNFQQGGTAAPPSQKTVPAPPGIPVQPPTSRIAAAPKGTAPSPRTSVINTVPQGANVTTKPNVPANNQGIPAVPSNGSLTQTTIRNSTTTTVMTTIAVSVTTTTTVTQVQQFLFTFNNTTPNVGVQIIVIFQLSGNVANNLPTTITGGATTGQTTTITTTSQTVRQIVSSTVTTSTTTGTSTTPSNVPVPPRPGTPPTVGPNNTNPATVINGVTRSVCAVPNNPYGLIQNPATEGTLVRGAFLVSSWNNAANVFGQGNIIYQCLPNGTVSTWANVTISGACRRDNAGVGLTMALSRCGSVIIVGSTPIGRVGGPASPGCLIALDTSGRVLNEATSPAINGPWGSVCSVNGNQITLAVSSVLGGLSSASPATAPAGRKLMQGLSSSSTTTTTTSTSSATPPASGSSSNSPATSVGLPNPNSTPTGGFVARFTFTTPTSGSTWSLGTPTYLASGIKTTPSAITNGTVGPGGLTLDNMGCLYIPDNLGNQILAIPNGLTTTSVGPAALALTNTTGSTSINNPNSVTFGNGQLLGTNVGDGKLFFIALNAARNGGAVSTQQVDPNNSPGVLFQAIYSTDASAGAPVGSIWFQHDGSNTLNTVINSGAPAPAPGRSGSAPATG